LAGRRVNRDAGVYLCASDGLWMGAVSHGYDERGTLCARRRERAPRPKRWPNARGCSGNSRTVFRPHDQITLNRLLDRWFDDVMRQQVVPSALENYRSIATIHLKPTLGRRRVSKLSPADVDALISEKLDAKLSSSTVRRIRAILSAAHQAGCERWWGAMSWL
jgi:hypothetical protein